MADGRTFGDMQTRIRREIKRDGLTADIRDAIVTAVQELQSERFHFNEFSANVATTVDDPYLSSVPTDVLEIDTAVVEQTSGSRYALRKVTFSRIENIDDGTSKGLPGDYAWHDNKIRVFPIPDAKYTIRFHGQKEITGVSASATSTLSNAWFTEAEPLVRSLAKEDLYRNVLRNEKMADQTVRGIQKAMSSLKKETVKKASTGRVVKTRF